MAPMMMPRLLEIFLEEVLRPGAGPDPPIVRPSMLLMDRVKCFGYILVIKLVELFMIDHMSPATSEDGIQGLVPRRRVGTVRLPK